jgi:hypothetical protein
MYLNFIYQGICYGINRFNAAWFDLSAKGNQ